MVLFIFKLLWLILFITEAVRPRCLSNDYEMEDKIDDVFISELLQNMLDKKQNSKEVGNIADLSNILANVTEKVALLRHQIDSGQAIKTSSNKVGNIDKFIDNYKGSYATEQDTTNPSLLKNVIRYEFKKTTKSTVKTDYPDYLGTAQLEELLNDIKARAIEMVAENPTVADLITNTVTEATFEADPFLNHLDISSLGNNLSTFVSESDVDNTYKPTTKALGVIHISKRKDERNEHQMRPRWCGNKSFAQSLEDTLQRKLKGAYHKVKNKVTKDYDKEMTIVKDTLEKVTSKIIGKIEKPKPCEHAKPFKPSKPCPKHLFDTTNPVREKSFHECTTQSMTKAEYENKDKISQTINNTRNVRADKSKMKKGQKVKSTYPTSTLSTVDDFAMLTLYEQILSKTHENNLMNLMATNSQRTNEVTRLSKRNPETLSDLRLKKDVKRKYDDEDNMPDADPSPLDFETTETQVEDTRLQALRDKIAFKEYVNGYKSYLDFQKENGVSDKFSNLIKYQAHKHHKVEDIGKFILDKIPPVPAKDVTKRRKRNFFDSDSEINKEFEDVIVPTKREFWFKKHFYIFERDPQSKFRTSQTVKFKEVTNALQLETSPVITNSAAPDSGSKKSWGMVKGNDFSLDELSKNLESNKHKPSIPNLWFFSSTRLPSTKINPNPANSQLFGKWRNIKSSDTHQKIQNKSPKCNEGDNFLFETNRRRKRKLMKTTQKIIDKDKKKIRSKINRDGYVTLVTQPTAIVNLIKTNDRESKIKKILSKLHLHRNKKKRTKMKKENHYCTRVQRFNPIKKLRNMFSPREMNELMASDKNIMADYDMITSHIDTFKSVMYNKLPSIEDLQKQVPNIPEGSYRNVTDIPGIAKPKEDSKTFNAQDSTIKEIQKKSHERKVLPMPKTFTVVLDPYPLHITKENHIKKEQNKIQKSDAETTSKMIEATTTKESGHKPGSKSNDTPKSESDDVYSDHITPFYDLFNRDEKTEADDKKELLNDVKQNTVLQNAIINKINQEYAANGTKPYSYFKYLKNEMPETTTKLDYREYDSLAEFIDQQADESYPATSTASMKRSPFFAFSDNTTNNQTKDHAKDRNKLLTERNLSAGAAISNYENKKTRFEQFYTQPLSVFSDSDYGISYTVDYYDLMSDSITDNLRWTEHTSTVQKYTTQSLKDMENELKDMRDRVSETDHRVKFINGLNEYAINKNMYNLRSDLSYKYSNDELEDLVRELNKIYLRRMESKWHSMKNLYKEPESSENHNARNIVKNRKAVKEPVHPIAKLNKQPKQLFNTPLPMTNAQFEKFLKDNNIDVSSVTSDLFPGKASNESQPDPVIQNNKLQITSEYNETLIPQNPTDAETVKNIEYLIGKSYPESQIDYLNDLEQSLNNDYNEIVNERRKRMTLGDDNDEALVGRTHYNKAKHHVTSSKPKSQMKKQYELKKLFKPKEDTHISIVNIDDLNSNEKEEHVTEPMHAEGIAQNFTNILLNALKTLESETDISNIDIKPDNSSKSIQLPTLVDSYPVEIGILQDYGRVTKAERKASPAPAHNLATDNNSDTITSSKLVLNGKHTLNSHKNNTRHNVQSREAAVTDIIDIIEVVRAVDDFTRPEVAIHIDLPAYYAPNNDIDVHEIIPLKKPSWTDLVIKYVSAIELIKMLTKLGILKGGLYFNESLDLNFDRFKVSTAGGVGVENARDKRTVPSTYVDEIDFQLMGPMSKNKRMFGFPFKSKSKNTTKTTTNKKTTIPKNTRKVTKPSIKMMIIVQETLPVDAPDTKPWPKKCGKLGLTTCGKRSTTMIIPSAWSEQSTEKSAHTVSDLWEYTTEETSSTVFPIGKTGEEVKETADEATSLEAESAATINSTIDSINLLAGTIDSTIYSITLSAGTIDSTIDPITLPAGTIDSKIDSITLSASMTNSTTDSTIDSLTSFNDENISTSGVTYKVLKRDVDGELQTAKGVAALEIIVDLMKHKGGEEISKQTDTKLGAADASESDDDIFTFRPPMNEATYASTNSIQVHIAIPYDNTPIKKRSPVPVLARKVFSARLASPVDLEYQIHYIDSIKSPRGQTTSTTNQAEIVSPGLYLLVDNFNERNNSFALKPVKISSGSYDADSVEKKARNASTNDLQEVKLSKAFLKAVNKHLCDLYKNMTESNLTKRTTHVKREVVYPKYLKKVRDIFENDRACDCKCKVNEPMCGVCAASDAVITELSFEFDNLAKYVTDHCTEIQTYFKMNPRGGKVLRDCIRRLDKSLDDYNKRNKGKCHGPTCKTFATYLHKRQDDHKSKTEKSNFVDYVTSLDNNFYTLSNIIPYVKTLKNNGDNFIRSAKDCLVANVKNRKCRDAMHRDDVYTFDNISVKFICSPESTSNTNNMPPFDTASTDLMYTDYDFKKRNLKPNILNKLFSRKKKQNKKSYATKIMHKKRQIDQVESPLNADAGGFFWRNYILRKTTSRPAIVISVVESNNHVKDRTTENDKQKVSERKESAGTSFTMDDLLNRITTNEKGDQENTINSKFWMKKTKKNKPTKKLNIKNTYKHHKKNNVKIYNNNKKAKQRNEAHKQYNNNNMSQYNMTKPNIGAMVTDITKRTISEIPTTDNYNGTLAIIPSTTSSENIFLKKIKMAKANCLKKMKTGTEGYQFDLGVYLMGVDELRGKRTEDKFTTKEKLTTKKSLQLISQQTVIGNEKPRFVVVTKPITLNANTQNKRNNCKSMVLSMFNFGLKDKQNVKKEKLFGDVVDNSYRSEEKDEQFNESKFTTIAGDTTESWFQNDNSTDSIQAKEQLDKKSQDTSYYDVFQELATPPEPEESASTVVWQQDINRGKDKNGLLTKNLNLVLRSMSTFAPDAEKEHENTETTKTTEITDASLANVEEADPFKTRVAEMSSSAYVPDPCFNSRCPSNIDRRENPRQQDENNISREKENNLDLNQRYDNVRIYRRTNLRNLNGVDGRYFAKPAVEMKFGRPGFDTYVRGDHGDYRIERDRRKTSTTSHVYVEKKMRKRSSSKVNTDFRSLSGWVQRVTINRFLATVLCFYLCCVAIAAAVSRAFRT